MEKYYIGFDTSAYTSSIGVLNQDKKVVLDLRKSLKVKSGQKGLRQQEAVFQHINNLPMLMEKLSKEINFNNVLGVASSYRPRNVEESYMPVFKVGEGQASILSNVLNVPHKRFSHQDGHIGSVFIEEELTKKDSFLALHISGGTTELLKVINRLDGYDIDIIGGTKDISAGQLIDRIGVKMGLNFPCGKEMDLLSYNEPFLFDKFPISTVRSFINFSGTETHILRLLDKENVINSKVIKNLFYTIAISLINIIKVAVKETNLDEIIVTGGVSANKIIRDMIYNEIVCKNISKVYFPKIKYATDNALGIAYLGFTKRDNQQNLEAE